MLVHQLFQEELHLTSLIRAEFQLLRKHVKLEKVDIFYKSRHHVASQGASSITSKIMIPEEYQSQNSNHFQISYYLKSGDKNNLKTPIAKNDLETKRTWRKRICTLKGSQ